MTTHHSQIEPKPRSAIARRGGTIVEAALVLNLVLVLMLGLFDFGRLVLAYQLLNNAAREGARLAVVNTNSMTTSQIQTAVTNYLAGQQLSNLTINVFQANPSTGANIGTWTNAQLGNSIAVTITANYVPTVPTFSMIPKTLPLQAVSIMTCEAN
jgi:Flp pilus assembly protein TadG